MAKEYSSLLGASDSSSESSSSSSSDEEGLDREKMLDILRTYIAKDAVSSDKVRISLESMLEAEERNKEATKGITDAFA